jgi:hypothetical protein
MTHEAIYQLYPTVKEILESENGVFTCLDENKNEVEINMSEVSTKATELQTAEDNNKQAQIDLKASAKAKLIAGEKLTEEEANILVGV